MKHLFTVSMAFAFMSTVCLSCMQKHKSKNDKGSVTVTQMAGDIKITVKYTQPSVKGRVIGENLEPLPDQIWPIGEKGAAVLELDRDVLIEGKLVPKGKYSLLTYVIRKSWILVFNKTWKLPSIAEYKEENDVLRVPVRGNKSAEFNETLRFDINTDGYVTFFWADKMVSFYIQPVQ
ncbi:MAG: DUF2911 domain-containing protein [Ferruginibacter sp.]